METFFFHAKYTDFCTLPTNFSGCNSSGYNTLGKQDLGLKCQTPLRLKAWVKEVKVFFYLYWTCESGNYVQLGAKSKPKLKGFSLDPTFFYPKFLWT